MSNKYLVYVNKAGYVINKAETNSEAPTSLDYEIFSVSKELFDSIPNEVNFNGVDVCLWNEGEPIIDTEKIEAEKLSMEKKRVQGVLKDELFDRILAPKEGDTIESLREEFSQKTEIINNATDEKDVSNGI